MVYIIPLWTHNCATCYRTVVQFNVLNLHEMTGVHSSWWCVKLSLYDLLYSTLLCKLLFVLCKLFVKKARMLIFDKPTNHLDLETVEALAKVFVKVSHDKHLIEIALSGSVAISGSDSAPGGLEQYKSWSLQKTNTNNNNLYWPYTHALSATRLLLWKLWEFFLKTKEQIFLQYYFPLQIILNTRTVEQPVEEAQIFALLTILCESSPLHITYRIAGKFGGH